MLHAKARRRWTTACSLIMLLVASAGAAEASNPRWVTGPPYFTVSGTTVRWYIDQPLYFTDPGDLSASVDHTAADAMVARAAEVWNNPYSRVILRQGGTLDEQVSGANTYLGPGGLVMPSDVQSSNYAAKPIVVIYDRDGSMTDLLLGGGASDPSGCRQNAVTESVDSITPGGLIEHAVLILNGRCTGPVPEQQLQMQYQLERVFGRILGLGWSQLNDNVFTGVPKATYSQALHWPIMHPIDIICGLYTYQCLPQPFTLRPDDIASLVLLYPVQAGVTVPGKQASYAQASLLEGAIRFPAPFDWGMGGVNVVLRRNITPEQVMETWDEVSAVSGAFMQQMSGNPITPKPTDLSGSMGDIALFLNTNYNFYHEVAGFFRFPWIPLSTGHGAQDVLLHTETINPLYTGGYAVGPYPLSTVAPSGDSTRFRFNSVQTGFLGYYQEYAPNAAGTCVSGGDGTEAAPATASPDGWWKGRICGSNPNPYVFGHTAWTAVQVRGNRSLTVEVTALDEQGLGTANKARPVIGVWSAADAIGSAPGVAAAASAFNSMAVGMTTLTAQSTQVDTLRIAISDERGDGRPDYTYRARILYADSIAPVSSGAGKQVTITGTGFRPGNTVSIGGIVAKVSNWSATSIVATVPFLAAAAPGTSILADVAVTDLSTQGSTVMTGGFQYLYTTPATTLTLVSAPMGAIPAGISAGQPFAVKAFDVDAGTLIAGAAIVFSAIHGSVSWGACGTPTCTVLTDQNGTASIGVMPASSGAVTLQAAGIGLTQQISFQAFALVRSVMVAPAVEYLAAGATVTWTLAASVLEQGLPAASTPLAWSATAGPLTISGAQALSDARGSAPARVTAGPLAGGEQASGSVCAWSITCGGFWAQGVDASKFAVVVTGGAGPFVPAAGTLPVLLAQITDEVGDPVAGAEVAIHQTVSQWMAPCPAHGRCPIAPVYQVATTGAISDSTGRVMVIPLQISGLETTDIAVTSGTQGFVSLILQKQPL